MSTVFYAEKCAKYAANHMKAKSLHKCATYVRNAIENENGGNLQLKGHPIYASSYYHHMEKWGFRKVFEGTQREFSSFKPQNGDISVIAGKVPNKKNSAIGHIQIYYNGKWISDFPCSTAWCYNDKSRPFAIWRHKNRQ